MNSNANATSAGSAPADDHIDEGDFAADLVASCGIRLEPWQKQWLSLALRRTRQGKWAVPGPMPAPSWIPARTLAVQDVLAARALYGLFVLRETRIVWVEANRNGAQTAFRRLRALTEANPDTAALLGRCSAARGAERITTRTGEAIVFTTPRGVRGRSADTVLATGVTPGDLTNIAPALTTSCDPQMWTVLAPDPT